MFSNKTIKQISYTDRMLNMMFKIKRNQIIKARNENVQKYCGEIKQEPTFNKNLINQKISPTSKSAARSFSRINENKSNDKWDSDNILNELDND